MLRKSLRLLPALLVVAVMVLMPNYYSDVAGQALTWYLIGGAVTWLLIGNAIMFKLASFKF